MIYGKICAVFILLPLILIINGYIVPNDLEKLFSCKYPDVECKEHLIKFIIQDLLEALFRFIDEIHVPVQNTNINAEIVLHKNYIYGMHLADVSNLKGFNAIIDQSHSFTVTVPQLVIYGSFSIVGSIEDKSIISYGNYNITLANAEYIVSFLGSTYTKKNERHMRCSNIRIILKSPLLLYLDDNYPYPQEAVVKELLLNNLPIINSAIEPIIIKHLCEIYQKALRLAFDYNSYHAHFHE